MARKRVHVDDYERTRAGRPEHVRDYTRQQDVRGADKPSMRALHRGRRPAPVIEHRPSELTPAEREATIDWYSSLPLAELRHRQDLADAQIRMAYEQQNTRALQDLQAMRDQLDTAVGAKFGGGFSKTRKAALESAIKELSRLQRKVNTANSSAPFVDAVEEFMASLRRGDPDMRLANDLAAHVSQAESTGDFRGLAMRDIQSAENYPGYVAHGYFTTVPGAYDILDSVRHKVVFEYGGQLPGNVTELTG